MEIFIAPKTKKRERVVMVRMTRDEATRTIQSLAEQINNNSANTGRWEHFCADKTDFSISVTPEARGGLGLPGFCEVCGSTEGLQRYMRDFGKAKANANAAWRAGLGLHATLCKRHAPKGGKRQRKARATKK